MPGLQDTTSNSFHRLPLADGSQSPFLPTSFNVRVLLGLAGFSPDITYILGNCNHSHDISLFFFNIHKSRT